MPVEVSAATPIPGVREWPAPVRMAAASRTQPRVATGRWLGRGLIAAGFGMFPWLVVLAISLPGSARAAHWSMVWIGLDGMEGVGLLATGWLMIRQDERCSLAATITATLVFVDAWFDVTTASGSAEIIAVVMAVCVEIPVALLCATVAVRSFPRSAV